MLILRGVTACFLVLALTALPASADPEFRVRTAHPRLLPLLSEGQDRSATFRDLVRRLQASDVIVHVEAARAAALVDGGLQFVTATSSVRYLRITLRTDLTTSLLVGLLGHELMHAVEVADHPGIRDEASFRNFYEQIGRATHRRDSVTYDTQAAVDAGMRVALELQLTRRWQTPTR